MIDSKAGGNKISYVNLASVAIIARSGVRLAKLQLTFTFTKFECIHSRVSVASGSYIVAAIYHPGFIEVCSTFHEEFGLNTCLYFNLQ